MFAETKRTDGPKFTLEKLDLGLLRSGILVMQALVEWLQLVFNWIHREDWKRFAKTVSQAQGDTRWAIGTPPRLAGLCQNNLFVF